MQFKLISRQLSFFFGRYFVAIVVITFLLIVGTGYMLFIKGTVSKIQDAGVIDLKSRQQELATKQEVLSRLKQLHDRYASVPTDQLQQLAAVLPSQAEIPFLVIEIRNFIEKNQLVLNSIDIGTLQAAATPPQDATPVTVKELPITLTLTGIDGYAKMKTFLDSLSTELPLLELKSLTYSPSADAYSLNLTTFYK